MAGTRLGGLKAVKTTDERYGKQHYVEAERKGNKAKIAKSFALMSVEKRQAAGKLGGQRSRRPKESERGAKEVV